MDVPVSVLRAELKAWLGRVNAGAEVVVTDRGIPVARLLPVDAAPVIERLTQEGVIARPRRQQRPTATGRRRVKASGPVADLISEQR
jgi:prevent-host-death family protein